MLFNLFQDDIAEILFHFIFHTNFQGYDHALEDFLPFKLSQFSVPGLLSKLG